MKKISKAEWRRKVDDIMVRVNRLFLNTGGRGPAWERFEAVVAEEFEKFERERRA